MRRELERAVLDRIAVWYMRNVMIPRREALNSPGFLFEKIGKGRIYLREFVLPEHLVVFIEECLGEKSYYIGKMFGFQYAYAQKMPTIKMKDKGYMKSYAHFLTKYVEASSYGDKLEEETNIEEGIYKLRMKNYIVCRVNGKGYIFSQGGIAGIWAWAMQDKTIEVIKPFCQGRGDEECLIIAAPLSVLKTLAKEYGIAHIPRWDKLRTFEIDRKYYRINAAFKTRHTKYSFKDLVAQGCVKRKGYIDYLFDERIFRCESSLLYFLEWYSSTPEKNALFKAGYRFGKWLTSKYEELCDRKTFLNILGAFGCGDIAYRPTAGGTVIIFKGFPWFPLAMKPNVEFKLISGILSGAFSNILGVNVRFELIKKEERGTFNLYFSIV